MKNYSDPKDMSCPSKVTLSVKEDPTELAIECRHLRFNYGYRTVLRGLTLSVGWGECLVVLGGNGTGKTTLLRIMATFIRPGGGWATVAGEDVAMNPSAVRRTIGLMGHQPLVYPDLTAAENLHFFARLHDVPQPRKRVDAVLAQVGLLRRADDRVREFSRGMQQRLSLARALIHQPRVLLLDEPDTGLDAGAQQVLREVLAQRQSEGMSVLLTTHRVDQGFHIGNRFAVLGGGRVVFKTAKADIALEELEYYYRACSSGTPP